MAGSLTRPVDGVGGVSPWRRIARPQRSRGPFRPGGKSLLAVAPVAAAWRRAFRKYLPEYLLRTMTVRVGISIVDANEKR